MPEIRLKSGSQYKVSEIVNPDGSLTVRNLLIKQDGIWEKEEREIDFLHHGRPHHKEIYSGRTNSFDRYNRTVDRYNRAEFLSDWIPAVNPADSFESSFSYSEAMGHRLRRQRLARSSLHDSPKIYSFESPGRNLAQRKEQKLLELGLSPINQYPETFRPSRRINSISNMPSDPPTPSTLKKYKRNEAKPNHKHVAFSEPLSSAQLQQDKDISNNENYTLHQEKEIINIYNDLEQLGIHHGKQSFSVDNSDAEDSSIFDNVAQTSSMDRIARGAEDISMPRNQKWISFADGEEENDLPNLYSVTVYKTSQAEKIGIYVHLEYYSSGNRLVVSKVASDGKFANTRIEEGDIVVSINGEDMMEDPRLDKALSVVTSATESITFVVYKDFEVNDGQSATLTSISSISKDLSSIQSAKDSSQINAFFRDNVGQRFSERFEAKVIQNDGMRTERITGDGSMLISKESKILDPVVMKMNESWKVSGVIVVTIEKNFSEFDKPGLSMGKKVASTGHVLYISDISSSSVFRKTPLRIGDVLISINGISLSDNADIDYAYSALGKPGKRITVVAKKGAESLNDFLVNGRRQSDLPREKFYRKRRGSVNTSSTVGTSVSGELTRNHTHDSSKSANSSMMESRSGSTSTGREEISRSRSGDSSHGLDSTVIERNESYNDTSEQFSNDTNDHFPFDKDGVVPTSEEISPNHQDSALTNELDSLAKSSKLRVFNDPKKRVVKKRQKVLVTVTKERRGQKIGIDFAMLNNRLVVTEISPTGLLRNAPLAFGDTILTINGVSFQDDPDVKEAIAVVKNARKKVTLEILKVEYADDEEIISLGTKSCVPTTLLCKRRKKTEHTYPSTKL